jgi:hypothetical protein
MNRSGKSTLLNDNNGRFANFAPRAKPTGAEMVNLYVGVTDYVWFEFLSALLRQKG